MIELPEAIVLSAQLEDTFTGKKIISAIAGKNPHKFAWYSGDPADYSELLTGKTVTGSGTWGSRVFMTLDSGQALIFGEGISLTYLEPSAVRPEKHQLLIEFNSGCGLAVTVRMYGFIMLDNPKSIDNEYIVSSMKCLNPFSEGFSKEYFINLIKKNSESNLSAKAFLATEQRIPGIGNGVLQDILFNAGIHPAQKLKNFSEEDQDNLYNSLILTLREMVEKGGRDTEKDLYGVLGGYAQIMSKNTVGHECYICGSIVEKKSYMGGSIYFCPECQVKE